MTFAMRRALIDDAVLPANAKKIPCAESVDGLGLPHGHTDITTFERS